MKNIILMLMLVVATSTQAQNTIGSYIGNKKEIKIKDQTYVTGSFNLKSAGGIHYMIYNKNGPKAYKSLERPKCNPHVDYDNEFDNEHMRSQRDQIIKEIFSSERLKSIDKSHYIVYYLDQNKKTQYVKFIFPHDSKISSDEIYQLDQKLKRIRFKYVYDSGCFTNVIIPIHFNKIK